jgi:hypothetical protein
MGGRPAAGFFGALIPRRPSIMAGTAAAHGPGYRLTAQLRPTPGCSARQALDKRKARNASGGYKQLRSSSAAIASFSDMRSSSTNPARSESLGGSGVAARDPRVFGSKCSEFLCELRLRPSQKRPLFGVS